MRLRYSAAANTQLDEIGNFIARQDGVIVAQHILRRVRAAGERLKRFPYLAHPGRVPDTFERHVSGLPYTIIYEVFVGDEDEVVVLNVFHGAQDRYVSTRRVTPRPSLP